MNAHRSKYGAVRTEVDGIVFASKAEAARYCELKLLHQSGAIGPVQCQPRFRLHAPGGAFIGEYRPDFGYLDLKRGREVYEDVKGVRTQLYKWKKKHVEAEYRIEIVEVP